LNKLKKQNKFIVNKMIMKKAFIIVATLFANYILYAQKDSIIAVNYFKNIIADGKITGEKYVILQKTYNMNNLLIKEISYDSTHKPLNVAYIFNNDGKPISREEYTSSNNLIKITRSFYNPSGRLIEEKVYEPANDFNTLKFKINYSYSDTSLIKVITYNSRNKQVGKRTINYKTLQCIDKTQYKKGFERNGIQSEMIITDRTNPQLITKSITRTLTDGQQQEYLCEYTFVPDTKLIDKETTTNLVTKAKIVKTFNYDKQNKVYKTYSLDENNNYKEVILIEPTNHFVDPGRKEMVNLVE